MNLILMCHTARGNGIAATALRMGVNLSGVGDFLIKSLIFKR